MDDSIKENWINSHLTPCKSLFSDVTINCACLFSFGPPRFSSALIIPVMNVDKRHLIGLKVTAVVNLF